jgi:hypothetical protein
MIKFIEHEQTGYAMRTWDNARLSDLTIAFSVDFTTPGEVLTRKAAYGKYHGMSLQFFTPKAPSIMKQGVAELLYKQKVKTLNIAGNGIYTLKKFGITQDQINDYMTDFLRVVIFEMYGEEIELRNGGQTGLDEACCVAGDRLGLETTCLAPKNWMFRNEQGQDICNQALFLKRFGDKYDVTDIL